jgi:hypothetical protein
MRDGQAFANQELCFRLRSGLHVSDASGLVGAVSLSHPCFFPFVYWPDSRLLRRSST